jgi:hypothetical protein
MRREKEKNKRSATIKNIISAINQTSQKETTLIACVSTGDLVG